jgi:hypothetical protein
MAQPTTVRDRFVAAIEKADAHFEQAGRALTTARTLTTLVAAASAIGVVVTLNAFPLYLVLALTLVLGVLARARIVAGLESLQWARHEGRDVGAPGTFTSGEIVALRAGWTTAVGDEEPVVAEIAEDDGRDGTARIVCEPEGGGLIIPNASVTIVARKGDLVRYTRAEGLYPNLWGLAGPASPISV